MCLIAWNWQPLAAEPLVLLANRDEFYQRPARALQWWDDGHILAGQDLQAGGTWLGVSRNGRMAALTNYRNPKLLREDAVSRGELVSAFLTSFLNVADYLKVVAFTAHRYNPFNLLVYDGTRMLGFESRHGQVKAMASGLGGVSNADFDTPWPKLDKLKQGLVQHLGSGSCDDATLLGLLLDREVVPDESLPDTGIGRERERALSSAFIQTTGYGTRACSVVRLGSAQGHFVEHSFDARGSLGVQQVSFAVDS